MGPRLEGKGRKQAEHQLYQRAVLSSQDKVRTSIPAEVSQMSDSKEENSRGFPVLTLIVELLQHGETH